MVKPTVISLFAGCGGSSLGYKWAGFKELLAVECDNNAVETFKLNFSGVPIFHGDIKELSGKECLKITKIKKGELDILDGSPPCQGFTVSGKRKVTDERNNLFKEYIRLIKELHPKVFVMENVPGMMIGKMKGKYLEVWNDLNSLNYNVKSKLMNAMWYEVPQTRKRLFFIGVRKDLNIQPIFPEPSKKYITVYQIIKKNKCPKGLEYPVNSKKLSEYIKKMKQGQCLYDVGGKYGKNVYRLNYNKPSPTIMKSLGQHAIGMIHPEFNRRITIPELKRICSFPDNFILTGSYAKQWARLGNSVMPKMMYHIAKNIKENILDKYYGKRK